MEPFTNLCLPRVMDTSTYDLTTQFFERLLSRAQSYDRGVGYFSSGWLRINARGMVAFANNGGRARWITSPILDQEDWKALMTGEAAKMNPALHRLLERNITSLEQALEEDVLSALAWMVADEVISFRLALPQNSLESGDFHDKFGVFTDAYGNRISFNGSYNDSIHGLRNYESIKIFCSWESPILAELVQADAERFERLWNNRDPNVRVLELPEAARERIVRLRRGERPYAEPEWVRQRRLAENGAVYQIGRPFFPTGLVLRDYQQEAVDAWFNADRRGLLEMATGTGKTITALAASVRLFELEQRLVVIIAVPYQHLVDQWAEEAKVFGYRPILAYGSRKQWLEKLRTRLEDYRAGYRPCLMVITTHKTFISEAFQDLLVRLKGPVLLIADEVHHLGAQQSRKSYPWQIPYRLALSATPQRWFDEEGSRALTEYFGETVFSFPLERAIGSCLTPYYYYPHLVPLTGEELDEYHRLSVKISQFVYSEDESKQEALERLLIKRARLLNNANNKLAALRDLLHEPDQLSHTLFYCTSEQIKDLTRLLGLEKGMRVHPFTAREDAQDRQHLLECFASGDLQALVAMKCLDEGVDVPETRTAYILASSGNPREFIQRRGRILRRAPGKKVAEIHDLIAVPPLGRVSQSSPTFASERKIMRRELQRFKEFAELALNKYGALNSVWELMRAYDLADL